MRALRTALALVMLAAAAACVTAPVHHPAQIRLVDPAALPTRAQVMAWHRIKDQNPAAFSGSPAWHNYMAFVERELRSSGVTDITRNAFSYDRWHSSEWPNDSGWKLISNGRPVRVASSGAYSGNTGPGGRTAPLVYYDPADPPASIAGKIVVFQPRAEGMPDPDYEYRSPQQILPSSTAPASAKELRDTGRAAIFPQLFQIRDFVAAKLVPGKAAGAIYVLDANYERLKGTYTFPVPPLHDVPSLFVDRESGAALIADARRGAAATLTLDADVTPTQTHQLVGFLPGRDYGKPHDEMIQLVTHSDGPSISQDNGPLGILGIVKYFASIPQARRPRTLMIFIDNRHYLPGSEPAFAARDWFTLHRAARDPVVAMIGVEHLGQMEFVERGEALVPSGRADQTWLWASDNRNMVDLAIRVVRDNRLFATVRNVERPGRAGRSQAPWYGMASPPRRFGKPGFGMMGSMDAYWTSAARIDRFDPRLFRRQVATLVQLTGELMLIDPARIKSDSSVPPVSAR